MIWFSNDDGGRRLWIVSSLIAIYQQFGINPWIWLKECLPRLSTTLRRSTRHAPADQHATSGLREITPTNALLHCPTTCPPPNGHDCNEWAFLSGVSNAPIPATRIVCHWLCPMVSGILSWCGLFFGGSIFSVGGASGGESRCWVRSGGRTPSGGGDGTTRVDQP